MTDNAGLENYTNTVGLEENKFINPALKAFILFVFKRWWIFLIIGLIGSIVGFFYAQSQKIAYESRLTFAVDAGSNDGSMSGAFNLAAQFGLALGSGQNMFEGENILEILKSRRIIEKVLLSIDSFDKKPTTLAEYYIEKSGLRDALSKKPVLAFVHFLPNQNRSGFSYQQDSILKSLYTEFAQNNIFTDRVDKKLSIYEIKVKSPDEKFSKIFTDKLVNEASNFYTEITSKKDRETLEILEQRVASLKANVSTSIDKKVTVEDANVNPAFAEAQAPGIKQQYNIKAYGEAYGEMFKTLELARYQYLKKIPLFQVIDTADYPMNKIKKSRLIAAIQFGAAFMLLAFFYLFVSWLFASTKKVTE